MDASDRPEGFTLKSKGQYKFEFICTKLTRRRGLETAPVKEIPSDDSDYNSQAYLKTKKITPTTTQSIPDNNEIFLKQGPILCFS